jgi:nucleotide-binding universal stress UspA family protein
VNAIQKTQRARRVLVAYDGSPSARRALNRAAAFYGEGVGLGLIHVSENGDPDDGRLEAACQSLASRGIEAEIIPASGSAAQAICVAAERDGYDVIVVGRRNVRDAGLLLLGSVAARVVAGAGCDVVVVA